jgi:hypothetical protein
LTTGAPSQKSACDGLLDICLSLYRWHVQIDWVARINEALYNNKTWPTPAMREIYQLKNSMCKLDSIQFYFQLWVRHNVRKKMENCFIYKR